MNYNNKFKELLDKQEIQTELAVPSRMHQLHYEEFQNLYGITKSLYFYNNSTNDQYKIKCILHNNFYNQSSLCTEIQKTNLSTNGLSFESVKNTLFEGSCEETNEIFEALKKEFYDPHLKIPVPPMK